MENEYLQQFHQQGYFTVPALLTEGEIKAVFAEIEHIVEHSADVPDELIQYEPRVMSGEVAVRYVGLR